MQPEGELARRTLCYYAFHLLRMCYVDPENLTGVTLLRTLSAAFRRGLSSQPTNYEAGKKGFARHAKIIATPWTRSRRVSSTPVDLLTIPTVFVGHQPCLRRSGTESPKLHVDMILALDVKKANDMPLFTSGQDVMERSRRHKAVQSRRNGERRGSPQKT